MGRTSTGGTTALGHLIGFDLGWGRSVSTCAMAAFSVLGNVLTRDKVAGWGGGGLDDYVRKAI